jgi:hypothetical protein
MFTHYADVFQERVWWQGTLSPFLVFDGEMSYVFSHKKVQDVHDLVLGEEVPPFLRQYARVEIRGACEEVQD